MVSDSTLKQLTILAGYQHCSICGETKEEGHHYIFGGVNQTLAVEETKKNGVNLTPSPANGALGIKYGVLYFAFAIRRRFKPRCASVLYLR